MNVTITRLKRELYNGVTGNEREIVYSGNYVVNVGLSNGALVITQQLGNSEMTFSFELTSDTNLFVSNENVTE